jgi:uncharacterized protein (TIGR03663 family)
MKDAREGLDNEIQDSEGRFDPVWLGSCVLITAVATVLRFVFLELKPLHHDEGVNGWFLTNLFRDGVYKYDPANYHGPTLYYIALAFVEAFGLNTWTIRSSVAIWGVLTVVLAFFLRRYIGKTGSLFAALFLALSPGLAFISRYFIHEIFFVFLSLAIVLSIVSFIEKRRAGPFATGWLVLILLVCFLPSTLNLAAAIAEPQSTAIWVWRVVFFIIEAALVFFVIRMILGWNEGRPVYFLLASACAALLFATKETAFITLGTMLIACGCVWAWRRIYKKRLETDDDEIDDRDLAWRNFSEAFGSRADGSLLIAAAALIFVYISILFFSSFFTYADGIKGAIEAYTIWSKTGSKDHTQNGMWAYLKWGMRIEAPIMILSAVGAVIALLKARHRFAIFTAFWAWGIFAAYSLIPYKTPWLALSFLLPMCIIAGYAINELVTSKEQSAKAAGFALAIAASVVLAYQTYQINFIRYDDEDMPYVYAHTRREFLDMMAEIDRFAEKSGKGKDAKIQIVSPDYWPMVWYTRDYPNAVFHGRIADADGAEMIVAKKVDQDAEVMRRYASGYEYIGSYALRPGVDLVLLVRRDLAGGEGKELYRMQEK